MNDTRVRLLKAGSEKHGPVVYWMSRDQRARDNWALLYAQHRAIRQGAPLAVIFCLVPDFLGACIRQYGFMLKGLRQVARDLQAKNISFHLLPGAPERVVSQFVRKFRVSALVTDFDPLRLKQGWKMKVATTIDIPLYEVDSHNIVPCWVASSKQEYGAYTLRPKIKKLLPFYLDEFPALKSHPVHWQEPAAQIPWDQLSSTLRTDTSVPEITWLKPGEQAAHQLLSRFAAGGLKQYAQDRNDPTLSGQSNLSPYLHFGQLSAQRAALSITGASVPDAIKEAILEELIVRRELADNFCHYNPSYDTFDAFPDWAKKTLNAHRRDRREFIYSRDELEKGETHDPLWNAAQQEMVVRGKMHGYLRMYWGKKILEWTRSPEEAMQYAICLNDRYELDGRDPNGYAGIAWSIGGVHDRAWSERPFFGKIRYMSYNGCRSKFNVGKYISAMTAL
jgi:deoxyribodipyrimidine photo-lyase